MPVTDPRAPFTERLQTFDGYWVRYTATARQLAALGHVYDRPPLEALEEGSRCIACSKFIPRYRSIRALENELDWDGSVSLEFHEKACERHQVRIPYSNDPHLDSLPRYTIRDTVRRFRSRSSASSDNTFVNYKHSRLLMLPVEIRLQIYDQFLPYFEKDTGIETIDRYSVRTRIQKYHHAPSISRAYTNKDNACVPSLLLSCSVIHDELLEVLFRSTTFKFQNTKLLYLFLRQIGHRGRRALNSVDVMIGYREDAMCFALLACCGSLQCITLRRFLPLATESDMSLWAAEGIATLSEIRGLDRVVFQDYLEPIGAADDKPTVRKLREQLTRPRATLDNL